MASSVRMTVIPHRRIDDPTAVCASCGYDWPCSTVGPAIADERERSNELFRGLRRTVTHGGLSPATLGTLVGIIDAILDEVSRPVEAVNSRDAITEDYEALVLDLEQFAQLVADTSNDPHLVKEAQSFLSGPHIERALAILDEVSA